MAQSAAILKSSLAVGSSGVSDIVEDTSPQLGGNLDVNGNSIVSTSNGDINISPNGTGTVVINTDLDVDNLNLNGNQITATDTNGDIWVQQDGTGSIYLDDVQVQNASIQSRFTNGSFNVNSKGTGSIFLDDLKIKDATIESNQTDQDITITPYGSGSVVIDGLSHPQADGTAGQVLQTDGEGNLSFADSISASLSTASSGSIDLDNSTTFELSSSNIAYNLSTPSETRITASDAAAGDNFGGAVAMSGDGNSIIVGTYADDDDGSNSGSAYIYKYNSGTSSWDETKLTASDAAAGDTFGFSVSMSEDGNSVIVGAKNDDDAGSGSGSAYIYKYNSGTSSWDETKLTASDAAGSDRFGESVAMSSDGNSVIVGAYYDGSGLGAAYVYKYNSGTSSWDETKLTASDGATSDFFGASVSISGDGNTVAVGNSNTAVNKVYVYRYNSGTSSWDETIISASDAASGDRFGQSISISKDSNTLAVGAYGQTSFTGAVYIFKYNSGTSSWDSGTKLTASDSAEYDEFGRSVSINETGELLVIGATGQDETNANYCGCTYYFTYSSSSWDSGTKVVNDTPESSAANGLSVGISDDGTRFISGSQYYDLPSGSNDSEGSSFVYDVTVTKPISISNGTSGQVYTIVVTSDGFSYSFSNTNLYWPNNSAPTPSAENKKDIYSIVKVGSNYYGSYAFNYN